MYNMTSYITVARKHIHALTDKLHSVLHAYICTSCLSVSKSVLTKLAGMTEINCYIFIAIARVAVYSNYDFPKPSCAISGLIKIGHAQTLTVYLHTVDLTVSSSVPASLRL